MGSSKTGSLDKFASFSPAAALASGKVKLPATGLVGMLQQRQEDKVTRNAARMAGQPQQSQYDQMMMQMMGQQKRPEFMSPYSPAPYANGGNVALRRKMFKLGGSASAHGTGLTSGLAFNEGGSVKPGPDGRDRVHASKAGFITDLLTGGATFVGKRGKKLYDDIIEAIGPKTSRVTGKSGSTRELITDAGGLSGPFRQYLRALRSSPGKTLTGTGITGAALGLPAYANLFQRGRDMNAPNETVGDTLGDFFVEAGRAPVTFTAGLPFYGKDILESKDFGEAYDALLGKGESYGDFYEKLYGSRPPTDVQEQASQDKEKRLIGKTVAELQAEADVKQREDLQAAMEMYQELIRGEDNTNKLMTLGDAAIAAGSALMEGEGYGAAATAFNEPLAQARMTQAERDQAAQSAAAQLAIGEDMSRRQADEALFNQLAAEGQLDSAEEIRNYMLATKFGVSKRVPEDEKGELDLEAMKAAGPAVYVDPKVRLGGLFIAFDGEKYQRFNSAEEAQQYTES